MNLKQFNDAFKRVYEGYPNIQSIQSQKIVNLLTDSIQNLNPSSIMDYAPLLENAVLKICPDKEWWEITSCNIRETLFDTKDVHDTISRIVECMDPSILKEENEQYYKGYVIKMNNDGSSTILDKDFEVVRSDAGSWEEATEWIDSVSDDLSEDTVKKSNGKWTNRGDDGEEHGEFKTKKAADAQRRAMYANGFKESWQEEANIPGIGWSAPTFYDYTDEIVSAKEYLKAHPENRIATKELKSIEGKLKEDYKKLDEFNYYWTKRYAAMIKFIDEQLGKIPEEFR